MAYIVAAVVVLFAVLLMMFVNLPPPELSPALKQWQKKGNFHNYNGHNVFYVGKNW